MAVNFFSKNSITSNPMARLVVTTMVQSSSNFISISRQHGGHLTADGAGCHPHCHGSQHRDLDHQHLRGAHAGRRPECVPKVRGSESALAALRPVGSGQVAMNYLVIANEIMSVLPGSLITGHSGVQLRVGITYFAGPRSA